MASVWTKPLLRAAENAMINTLAVPPLASNRVMEYTNSVVLTENTVIGDLVEATYDGYSRGSIASWVGPQVDVAGNLVVTPSVPVAFSCSGNVTVNTLIGVALLDSTGTTLLAAAEYATSFSPIPGQVHTVKPGMVMSGTVDNCLC